MQKNIYIDADEEIISVLEKIRRENNANSIILVVPQKAILTQGVINLKMLQREAEKLGKNIAIATPSKRDQIVIKRVGITLAHDNTSSTPHQNFQPPEENYRNSPDNSYQMKPAPTNDLGSSSFYYDNNQKNQQSELSKQNARSNFTPQENNLIKERKTGKGDKIKASPKKRKFWGILLLLFILGGLFVWGKDKYPKIKITLYPKNRIIKKELRLMANANNDKDLAENEIKGRTIEVEAEKTLTFPSTGEAFEGDDGKARGKITIINNFSSANQKLVATTRFLSKDGKLFRLKKDLIVPGKRGETAGKIEAEVVADKAGSSFNIEPSEFTIEGFKGGPKYSKITAKSSHKMTGGNKPDQSKKIRTVTEEDLKNARIKTDEAIDEQLTSLIKKKLDKNEKAFLASAKKEIIDDKSSRAVKSKADEFSYSVKKRVKLIAFNTEELEKKINTVMKKELEEDFISSDKLSIKYKKDEYDIEKNVLIVDLEAENIFWKKLNQGEIKNGLLNKSESQIKDFLNEHEGIKKTIIETEPPFLIKFTKIKKGNIEIEEKLE